METKVRDLDTWEELNNAYHSILIIKLSNIFKSYSPKLLDLTSQNAFEDITRVYDWRNHIPSDIKSMWGQLSHEAKLVAAIMAQNEADKEEWE